ncbi:FAD:protein FMN transferase, partial [Kitasatospora sp. NPDC036755]|uniref:FAD:protein FMN transferase n=1 Tax=Kitasatospora sp. NPDC036755 TaxID=3154600 RepID=UPI0033C9303C
MLRHAEPVMGTVFSITVRDPGPGTPVVLERITERLHRIDTVFSTYRPDSDISRLDRGDLAPDDCDPEVGTVLAACRAVAAETDGYFSERPGGRLDPSGWVKGWAVQQAADLLRGSGARQYCVSGGGDVQTVGGPWRIGIADPRRPGLLAAVLAGHDLTGSTAPSRPSVPVTGPHAPSAAARCCRPPAAA